jgi:hypothetical protein
MFLWGSSCCTQWITDAWIIFNPAELAPLTGIFFSERCAARTAILRIVKNIYLAAVFRIFIAVTVPFTARINPAKSFLAGAGCYFIINA